MLFINIIKVLLTNRLILFRDSIHKNILCKIRDNLLVIFILNKKFLSILINKFLKK